MPSVPLVSGTDGTQWKRYWEDLGMQEAGYSYDFLSPALLNLPNAQVTDGRLAVDGPDYDETSLRHLLRWRDSVS